MPSPGPGGSQSSLAGMVVSWLTSQFRTGPKQQPKKGAPIASYTMGTDPTALGGNARGDVTQFRAIRFSRPRAVPAQLSAGSNGSRTGAGVGVPDVVQHKLHARAPGSAGKSSTPRYWTTYPVPFGPAR